MTIACKQRAYVMVTQSRTQDRASFVTECSGRVHFLKEYVPADVLGDKYLLIDQPMSLR